MKNKGISNKRKKLAEQISIIFEKRGRKAFEIAEDTVLSEKITYKPLSAALKYFFQESSYGFQYPALVSLTCEAVGGDPEGTVPLGAAIVLLTAAADIHDDIIDLSTVKGSKATVFGKFGKDLALLSGDALLFEGLTFLAEASRELPQRNEELIVRLIKNAFFELGNGEAEEIGIRGKLDLPTQKCFEIIKKKASVAEATAKIGAIVGGGSNKEIEVLGKFGRTLGTLAAIRDDFIDLFEPAELKNRLEHESLPLPLASALQNERLRDKIMPLLEKETIKKDTHSLVDLLWKTEQVQGLIDDIQRYVTDAKKALKFMRKIDVVPEFTLVLDALLEDLG